MSFARFGLRETVPARASLFLREGPSEPAGWRGGSPAPFVEAGVRLRVRVHPLNHRAASPGSVVLSGRRAGTHAARYRLPRASPHLALHGRCTTRAWVHEAALGERAGWNSKELRRGRAPAGSDF